MRILKFGDFSILDNLNNSRESVILYHGSDSEFDAFDDTKMSTGDSSELFGRGL